MNPKKNPEKKKVIRRLNTRINRIARLQAEVRALQIERDRLDTRERLGGER